jgi:hypothetical protein
VKTIFWTFLCFLVAGRAPAMDEGVRSLAGVPLVYVLVEDLSDDLKAAGLSADILVTDAELRLRTVGISVGSRQESLRTPGFPYLYVRVTGRGSPENGYYGAVSVEFFQEVRLVRSQSIRVSACTWQVNSIFRGGDPKGVRGTVRDLSDAFANAYLAANPKHR